MPITKAGLKTIFITKAGQIEQSSPSYPFALGLRTPGDMIITPVNEQKDHLDRYLRNMYKVKVESSTFQCALPDLKTFLNVYLADAEVDAQIVVMDKWGDGSHKLFQFEQAALTSPGFDFEYMVSEKEKNCKIILECDLHYQEAKLAIDSAQVQGINPWLQNTANGLGNSGIKFGKYTGSHLIDVKSPSGTDLFSRSSIVTHKLNLKPKGSRSEYGRLLADYLTVNIEIVSRDNRVETMQTLFNRDQEVYIKLVYRLDNGNSETFIFNQGSLTCKNEFKRGDSEVYSKVTYGADVPLSLITIDESDPNNIIFSVTP